MNENRDRLDDALDASLARNFQVPEDPAAGLQHLFAPGEPSPALAGKRSGPGPLLFTALALAAASVLGLVGWLRREAPVHEPLAVQGPGDVPADPVREPDLTTLYYEISTALEDPFLCPSPEGLADELSASYDCCEELRVDPHVTDLLEGPFDSAQWPGGTILTGRAGDSTAVLIADLDSTYRCCVRPQIPEESELEVFTVRLGDLVLTEVTPLSEPRLLDYFSWDEELR